ncbi:MAG: PRC-barrel domain-containing protein [Eggerthellaceae bacterium]|nr:PRC-barrel domain-containing protein [Eggerthellaceae bacterium]
MASKTATTNGLTGTRVIGGKSGTRRIGKVRRFVFHPTEKRVIGFIVKRPDFLWMFRRRDKFVSIDGYDMVDGRVCIRNDAKATDGAAYKALGVNPDECILWVGLPIMLEDGQSFGIVGNVVFNTRTGAVQSIESDSGMTSNALLGKRDIPADMIKGFHKGIGAALAYSGEEGTETDSVVLGAVLVSKEVAALEVQGGLAEKAGKGAAIVADKAGKATAKVSKKASAGAKVAGKAVNKGAYVTGRQIGRTKGMFSSFKDEYSKARHSDTTK